LVLVITASGAPQEGASNTDTPLTEADEVEINKLRETEILKRWDALYGDLPRAVAKFTQSFYLHLIQNGDNPNFVFSPLSLHSALSLLFLGTTIDSKTWQEMRIAMGSVSNPALLETYYKNVVNNYANQSSFLYGNRLWIGEDFEIKEEYKNSVMDNFKAEISQTDFTEVDSVNEVNEWVRDKTNDKIKQLIDNFSSGTKLFLANALYFSERWKYPFTETGPLGDKIVGDFMTGKGERKKIDFIQQTSEEIIYGELTVGNAELDVVTVPYMNEDFEMQIIVPKKNSHLEQLEAALQMQEERDVTATEEPYINIFSALKNETEDDIIDVRLTMPTFQVETKFDAAQAIETLGAKKIFTENAELDRLSEDGPLGVSKIVHRAVIEVSKEGTEGAAATGVELVLFSAGFGVNKNVVVDQPFIFIVQDRVNKIPVLVGRVEDPTLITRIP